MRRERKREMRRERERFNAMRRDVFPLPSHAPPLPSPCAKYFALFVPNTYPPVWQVRSDDLACDESALTGESKDILKSAQNPFVLSGTSVKMGSGVMIVTCVGIFSEEGIIRKLITGLGKEESKELEMREAEAFHVQAHTSVEECVEGSCREGGKFKENGFFVA